MADNSFEKVVAALATIQAYADGPGISIEVIAEALPHPKLINAPARPTGREILVIRVPYDRTRLFLIEQLKRMQEQRMNLTATVEMADAEIADLERELANLVEPKPAN